MHVPKGYHAHCGEDSSAGLLPDPELEQGVFCAHIAHGLKHRVHAQGLVGVEVRHQLYSLEDVHHLFLEDVSEIYPAETSLI